MNALYIRRSSSTLFLLPAVAVGIDIDGRPFIEIAWLNIAIGIGEKP